MLGFSILLAFQLLGILVKELTALQLPSNVTGLVLFTIFLFLGWIKLEWVETASEFLLKHMLLFFMPLVVGSVALHRFLGAYELLASLITLVISTVAVLLITGWLTKVFVQDKGNNDAGSV